MRASWPLRLTAVRTENQTHARYAVDDDTAVRAAPHEYWRLVGSGSTLAADR